MKNFKIIFPIALILIVLLTWWFARPQEVSEPSNLISQEEVRSIVKTIINSAENSDEIIAYLYPTALEPGTKIESWGGEDEGEETEDWTFLAWLDLEPGNAFFAHPTRFVRINARSGKFETEDQEFWPVIDGEPFEGSEGEAIMPDINETEMEDGSSTTTGFLHSRILGRNDKKNYFNRINEKIRKTVFKKVNAQSAEYVRITKDKNNAPPGEYYALIVSGFGRNSWVFMEGAHQMYEALKKQGYDDANITFLGQGPAKLDPTWDRKGQPKLVKSEAVDAYTSRKEIEKAIGEFAAKMTKEDSLYVFILAHGKKNYLSAGKNVTKRKRASQAKLLKGYKETIKSDKLAEMLLATIKACEVMVTFDSCYSGTHKAPLQAAYDPTRVKRLAVAHSTDGKTKSFGADYRWPVNLRYKAKKDLDNKAKKTPFADKNPGDHGGEFSSGIIEHLKLTIFSGIYTAAEAFDAALANDMTKPSQWSLGDDGACTIEPSLVDPPPPIVTSSDPEPQTDPEPQDEPKQDEPEEPKQDEPEESEPKVSVKLIEVIKHETGFIPVEQLTSYNEKDCDCCDEEHWHAKNGTAQTIDGKTVTDPYSGCGLGKVSEKPVQSIEVPDN